MRSSMMSRALWARKWYFREAEGLGRVGVARESVGGVEGGLGKSFR